MRSCGLLNEKYMKNKDIHEWLLDEGIDPLTTITTEKGEYYLSDILEKHLTEQLRLFAVIKSLPDSDEIRMKARELDEKDFAKWMWELQKGNVL